MNKLKYALSGFDQRTKIYIYFQVASIEEIEKISKRFTYKKVIWL